MEDREIRLEIAKAAMSAGLSKEEAQQWVNWVLEEHGVSAGLPATPSPREVTFTDDELAEELWDQFGGRGISWEDFIHVIRYESQLSLKMAIACCALYGIDRKPREVIISVIEHKEVVGQIPYSGNGYGGTTIQGKYHINKLSLVRWLDVNYSFRGTGIVKLFWDASFENKINHE